VARPASAGAGHLYLYRVSMAYILARDLDGVREDIEHLRQQWERYTGYLESVRPQLPQSAFDFATAPWRYDGDHRDLHDSWVESVSISEVSSGERHQHRHLGIEVRLLGAYHDGRSTLSYRDVQSYSLETLGIWHGDWLRDEVRLSENGFVLHEVEFSQQGRWLIECKDIVWTWESTDAGTTRILGS
jgi:hypothetical protein